jgi:hypothetical protein
LVQVLLSGTFADAHRALVNQGALPPAVDGKTFDGMSLTNTPFFFTPQRRTPFGNDASRTIMCRSPEALARGPRRHCIPASLSLPRVRVPSYPVSRLQSVPRPAAFRVGAMLTLLRLPCRPVSRLADDLR